MLISGSRPLAGSGDEVDRDRLSVVRVGVVQGFGVRFDGVQQSGVERTQVRSARGRSVVGLRAGGGGPAPEILRIRETLTDQSRADELAVLMDQAALGLARKCQLRDARDEERIRDAEQDRHRDEETDR